MNTTTTRSVESALSAQLARTRPVVVAFDEGRDGSVRATVRHPTGAYTVNLSRHMVSLMESQHSTVAIAAVIRTRDEQVGTAIDIVA